MSKIKSYVNRQKKRLGKWSKKRYGTWSKPKVGQIVKDVMWLKNIVNAEKKRYVFSGYNAIVGQVNGTGSGHYALDITPLPPQGATSGQRSGNSIKLSSSYMCIQYLAQSAVVSPIRIKMMLFYVKGPPYTNTNTLVGNMFVTTPFVINPNSVYDYNSSINPDFFGQFQLLKTKRCTLPVPQISGQTQIRECCIKMRYNKGKGHHVRYAADGGNVVSDGQLVLVILTDTGNSSSTTANTATAGVINKAVNTGVSFNYSYTHYFYDN